MRSEPRSLTLVAAALLGLVAAPPLVPLNAAAVMLCGGGVMLLDLGDSRRPVDPPGACHAACMARRDDDSECATPGPS